MNKLKMEQLNRMIQILSSSSNGLLIRELADLLRVTTRTVKRYVMELRYTHPIVDIREAANKHSRFKLLETQEGGHVFT